MKRALLVLVVAVVVPTAVSAQLGVGPAASYTSPVLLGQAIDEDEVNVDQFSFGGDRHGCESGTGLGGHVGHHGDES